MEFVVFEKDKSGIHYNEYDKDYHDEKTNKGEICMYDSELKLANELLEITDKLK